MYIVGNQALRSLAGLSQIWFVPTATPQYYPLVHTSFWLEYHLWGLDPRGYHAVNVALHALSALVLWRLLVRLEVPAAWFAAAVFALHPVHVESVAWATERKNALSGLLYLCALTAYLRFALPGEDELCGRRAWRWYAVGFVLFVGALLAKTVTASLPAAVVLLIWWKGGRIGGRQLVPLVPFFAVGVALALHTAWLESHHVGAAGTEWSFSFVDRCLIAGRAVWFYAAKLLWPARLSFIYPRWRIDARVWWQYLFPLAAAVVVAGLWLGRRRTGRGPLVAVLLFMGTLFPALGFVNVYPMRFSFVADHFQYHASMGLIAVFAAAGVSALGRLGMSGRGQVGAGVAVLALLATLTWRQGGIYRDEETLYRDTVAKNPECWMAHSNLGQILAAQGKTQEALAHLLEALRLSPNLPEGHNNLGTVLEQLGRIDDARAQFTEAVRLLPDYADAHYNLGRLLAHQGRVADAAAHFSASIGKRPEFAPAHNNLGTALFMQGRTDEAIAHYREALRIDPNFPEAHVNLGNMLEQRGDLQGAIAEYTVALRSHPSFAPARERLAAATAKGRSP